MNDYFKKNILIVRGFDTETFFQEKNKKNWDLFSFKSFIKIYRKVLALSLVSVVIGVSDISDNNLKYFLELLLVFIRAKRKYFIDNKGIIQKCSLWRFIFIDTPLFIGELIFDVLLIIFSWLALFIFYLIPKRKFKRLSDSKEIIYLRTDNFRGMQQGGSFTHFRGVVKGFDKLGYKIHYIGSGEIQVPQLNFPKDIISYPLKFNLPEIPEIYYNWRFIPRALRIIKREKPLFIYQRHSIFNVCGAILSQLTGVPLVLEYNGSEPWIRQKWGGLLIFKRLCYFMEDFSLKRANIITVVSKVMKDELIQRRISEKKILVNYNGVDPEKFNPNIDGLEIRKKLNLENKIVIGAVSTFGVWHGMPVLAKAIKFLKEKLRDTNYRFHVLFIGDGVERPKCERIIQETKMEDYVTFTGIVPYANIPQYLAACDILVSPHVPNPDGTPFFGSPTKLFEYMAMGKGIVASKLGQIGEILEHQKTAWLVRPGDVNDLVNGIIKLIENKKLREELGRNAREKVVKNYTWEQNVKRVINNYEKLYQNKIS